MEPMMTALAVLEAITKDLATMTDADVRRAERNIGPLRDGEKALGAIHNVAAQRAWALANSYEVRGMEAALSAKFRADSEEEQTAMIIEAHRCAAMQKIVRDLFWTQAKEDIGGDAWCKDSGIGVRSGWMLVALAESPVEGLLSRLIGGGA